MSSRWQADLADAYESGLAAEKSGNIKEAVTAFRQCLALDPDDRCGASVRLASLGAASPPQKAPDAYVATLFDQHADDFDTILTEQLNYAVPMELASWMDEHDMGPFARMLDLGCGTGLSGMMLGHICDHATGVDISEQMIDKADERAAYDELFVNEAVEFLGDYATSDAPEHQPFDLIVATDVLPYIGALEPLFDGIAANATDRAVVAFSCETLPSHAIDDKGWSITPHQRFAHSANYLRALCSNAGFSKVLCFENITVRLEQGQPITGFLVLAGR